MAWRLPPFLQRLTFSDSFSTIWLARALPEDGELVTLELQPKHAEVVLHIMLIPSCAAHRCLLFRQVAQGNIAHAGLASKVKIIVGPAAESITKLQPEPPFDFAFIDADKPGNLTYFLEAKRLVRKNGVIVGIPRCSGRQV